MQRVTWCIACASFGGSRLCLVNAATQPAHHESHQRQVWVPKVHKDSSEEVGKETGKMYVQCCLLLETKNRAPVTVQDMVKHFPMSRGALPSRTSWDQC